MLREYETALSAPLTKDSDTLYTLLAERADRFPTDTVAEYRPNGSKDWVHVSAHEMLAQVRAAAKGLISLGVAKGDSIVIYSATCYHWGVVDFACAAIGAVLVPIYETDSTAQALSIVTDVAAKIAFADNPERTLRLEGAKDSVPSLSLVFTFQQQGLAALQDWGHTVSESELETRIAQVKADDVATIVYTSGSTGKPKGACLSHRNFLHLVRAGYQVLPTMLAAPSRLLLFLPLAHCFARYIQYVAIGARGVVGYIPSADHLLADLRSFKPTYLLGVPRVFEKVYNAASQKAGAGLKGRVLAKAYAHFVTWSKDEQAGRDHSPAQVVEHAFYERTVGSSVRSALGPNLAWLACGGAPLDPDLAHFFNGIDGITLIQGYGMTETAAPCCVNFEAFNKIGTVGRPGPGITVRLASDDELLIKGPGVFLGYKDDPERTAQTIDKEAWLHSGDLAQIDEDGFITITGRKKDILITAGGKNVVPAPLEQIIATCPIVSHVVVLGDSRPFISALVSLEPDTLGTWLKSQKLDPAMSREQAANSEAVRAFVQQYVDRANLTVSRAEAVRKFVILPDDLNQANGTLTPSQKVVRQAVLRTYAKTVATQLYPAPAGAYEPSPSAVLLSRTSKTVKEAGDEVSQLARTIVERASSSVNPLLQQVQENTRPVIDSTLERLEPVLQQVQESAKPLLAGTREKLENGRERLEPLVDKTKERVEPLLDKTRANLNEGLGSWRQRGRDHRHDTQE